MATREQLFWAQPEHHKVYRRYVRNLIAIVIVSACAATMGIWLAS